MRTCFTKLMPPGKLNRGVVRANSTGHTIPKSLLGVAGGLLLLAAVNAPASDGYRSAGSGSWANAGNWDSLGGVADGADNSAYFGFSFEPPIPANAAFTLDGARTIGNLYFTTDHGPANWVLNTGSGGPLTLNTTFGMSPGIHVGPANLRVTINTVLAGTQGLTKDGDGTLVLTAMNTYSGDTTVGAGTLLMNGAIGTGKVLVQGGTFNATGTIGGPIDVQSGGAFSLSAPLGDLTINNTLKLAPGSTTVINVNAATLAHDTVDGLTSVVYGGTLSVNNLAGALSAGESFQIFSAAAESGNFSSIIPAPGKGLRWQFNPASGVLSVVPGGASQPGIANAKLNGQNLVFLVTNGAPQTLNYVLSATDPTLPVTSWTRIATNTFDANGSFLFTNPVNPGLSSQRFYLISTPAIP